MPSRPTVVLGRRIFTADARRPFVQALSFEGSIVTSTGDRENVMARNRGARLLDVSDRVVVPGVVHPSLDLLPAGAQQLPSSWDLRSWDRTLAQRTELVAGGTWILATPPQDGANVSRDHLDRLAPQHPVLVVDEPHRLDVANSRALRAARLMDPSRDVLGGLVERDEAGGPSGRVFGYARWAARQAVADSTSLDLQTRALRRWAERALRYGVTSANVTSWGSPLRFLAAVAEADLTVRLRLIDTPGTTARGRHPVTPSAVRAAAAEAAGPLVSWSGRCWFLDSDPSRGLPPAHAPALLAEAPDDEVFLELAPRALPELFPDPWGDNPWGDNPWEGLRDLLTTDPSQDATAVLSRVLGHHGGRLVPGADADFAVLSQDVFAIPVAALPAIRSDLTVVAGLRRHQNSSGPADQP